MTVAIIGNGISGITAARHIRKADSKAKIVVISSETPHFYSRTALMYVYMGHMRFEDTKPYEDHFWKKNRIELVFDHVEQVKPHSSELVLRSGKRMGYDQLLIAAGSRPNFFGWPGQDLKGVQGLYSYQDLQLLEANTHAFRAKESERRVKRAVITGGGLIGVELAEMLITRGISVTFLVREDRFWGNVLPEEEGLLVVAHMQQHGVDLRLNSELRSIEDDGNGRAGAVVTSSGEWIECQLVGITTGVSPNIAFLKDSRIALGRGVLVDRFMRTNFPNVYAAGDCAEQIMPLSGRRPVEQVWYTGRMMGEVAASNIAGIPALYEPGPWFNSAKFFDIEYQTYGEVPATKKAEHLHFYWEDANRKRSFRMVVDAGSTKMLGINVFGIRLRHEVLDRWLREGITADAAMKAIRMAQFDPEFTEDWTEQVIAAYTAGLGTSLRMPSSGEVKV